MAEFDAPPQITRDDLIETLRRNLEPHYIELLLADPSSLSVFEGIIAALLRVQDAVDENLYRGAFILSAPGISPASSTVRLQRPSGPEVTINTTTRFLDNRGAIWFPSADFTIPVSGGLQTVDVPIVTDRAGYYLDSFEPLTYRIVDPLPDPTLITIPGVDPATGGTTPFLDQHGKERKTFRAQEETDAEYRNRIRFLEDQVSPKAISDTVVEVLDQFPTTKGTADLIVRDGLRVVREPFRDTAQHAQRGLTGTPGPLFFDSFSPVPAPAPVVYDGGAFFDDPHGGLLRDLKDICAWFDVLLPTPVDPAEGRRFFDDGDAALGAYFDDAFADLVAGAAITAPISALADELNRRRAGCVRFRILFGEDIGALRHPQFQSLDQAGDWTDQDGSADDLDLTDALASHDGDGTFAFSGTGTGGAAALAAGDLLFDMPAVTTPLGLTRVVLRARARRRLTGAGTDPDIAFILQPTTAGAPERITGAIFTVSNDLYQEFEVILDENPIAAAPWALADIGGIVGFGVANAASVGATEDLLVSELSIEFVSDYG